MNSEEIKEHIGDEIHDHDPTGFSVMLCGFWLKEIAYQLAVMNEREHTLSNMAVRGIKGGSFDEQTIG